MEKHQACKLNVTKIAVAVEKSFVNTLKIAKRKRIQQKYNTIIKNRRADNFFIER